MSDALVLHTYWRSSAAYRVRIALHLKGLAFESVPVHLLQDGGQQRTPAFAARNPQRLVPTLQHGAAVLTQSLAIIEYLDEVWPEPSLLPGDAAARHRARALAQLVACDVHPLGNLRVLQFLEHTWSLDQAQRHQWLERWITEGLAAFEALLTRAPRTGDFCIGPAPTIADCALVPQLYNARRFGIGLDAYPRIRAIEAACLALPAFDAARPERQPDAA
ncbi:maleylacetoacetate isomerase [Luteimonas sp BLCC-B24]|uniref:maleylacetoacetate isomerase n=1 Tax=Luteimonas sp. BLCC-B24 TaxID=3025317 RepID=UPI00234D7360|nr:maleylacetoacetate isomerase [Luteimonas sp. BLCC-B24]MDC7807928.1 maleylacetoacetate isomerase [Luteimonas sp. BLCC-B24]